MHAPTFGKSVTELAVGTICEQCFISKSPSSYKSWHWRLRGFDYDFCCRTRAFLLSIFVPPPTSLIKVVNSGSFHWALSLFINCRFMPGLRRSCCRWLESKASPEVDVLSTSFASALRCMHTACVPVRFLSVCVWFRDVTSFSDASGMVCVRVGTCFYIEASDSPLWLTFARTQTIPDASEKDVTSRNQTHAPKNVQDAWRVHTASLGLNPLELFRCPMQLSIFWNIIHIRF